MGLRSAVGAGPVGLDTCLFIYLIEEHPDFLPVIEPLFHAIDAGDVVGVTSGITLLEVLVVPYRTGNIRMAERYEALLTRSRGIRMFDLDAPLMRAAASIRAQSQIKTPDALQLAAAVTARCPVFVTNDRRLPPVTGVRSLQLSDFV